MEIELLKLVCPNCASKIQSLKSDNLHFCSVCGKGFYLRDRKFVEIKTIFIKEHIKNDSEKVYLPFWDLKTDIDFEGKTFQETVNIIKIFIEENYEIIVKKEQLDNMEYKQIEFIIPAFGTTNRYLLLDNMGLYYTLNKFDFEEGKPFNMLGGKYRIEDLIPILKSFLFSMFKRKEMIIDKKIYFNIIENKILGIPFFIQEKILIDSIYGKKMFLDAVENIGEILGILKT